MKRLRLFSNQRVRRTLSVGIKNGPSGFVSNCKLYIDYRTDKDEPKTIQLADTFSLFPDEERLIAVLYCDKSADGSRASIKFPMIQQGFFSYEYFLSAEVKHMVTLRLETADHGSPKVHCYVWIDEHGKLKLERV